MNITQKKSLVALLALCLIALLAFGSLAYFQDSASLTNTFKTATTDDESSSVNFSISLYESDLSSSTTTEGNAYTNIYPGQKLTKDPTVKNTGAYDEWVRVKVTFDKYDAWQTALGTNVDLISALGISISDDASTGWTSQGYATTEGNTITYVYYYNSKLAANSTATLFSKVTIPTSLTTTNLTSLNGFSISVVGEAIQADGFDSYSAAFAQWTTAAE